MPPAAARSDHYEVLDGCRVELPISSYVSARVAFDLGCELRSFCRQRCLGWVAVEALFTIPTQADPGRNRKPDVAFVSFARWPADRPHDVAEDAWPVVPDLVVEVLNPTDHVLSVSDKLYDYFEAGVRLVWIVNASRRTAVAYIAPDHLDGVDRAGTLDGRDVLPGFTIRLADLFAPPPG